MIINLEIKLSSSGRTFAEIKKTIRESTKLVDEPVPLGYFYEQQQQTAHRTFEITLSPTEHVVFALATTTG